MSVPVHVTGGRRTLEHPVDVGRPERGRTRVPYDAAVEIAVILAVYVAYKAVRFMVRDNELTAHLNAERVVEFEKAVGLWTEPAWQDLALRWEPAIEALNWFYAHVHMASTVLVLVFLFAVDRPNYRWLRQRLVGVTIVALPVHLLFPLAPPRMVALAGMTDTLQEFGPAIYANGSTLSRLANPYAAMPSLHFGYAVLLAAALMRWSPSRAGRWFALHPVVMLIAIVVTANHYWIDAIVAALLIVAVCGFCDRLERRRAPERARSDREVDVHGSRSDNEATSRGMLRGA